MSDAAQRHEGLVALLRESEAASERILDAFARVPRHTFLPGVPLGVAYTDDAIVTQDEGGVPTSSSSQPSLMARMLEQLELERRRPRARDRRRHRLQRGADGRARGCRHHRRAAARGRRGRARASRAAGIPRGEDADAAVEPGSVLVVCGDGAAPPGGPYERIIITAGCWSLPAAVVGVARRRRRARRAAARQRRRARARVAPRGRRAPRRRRDPVRVHAAARRRRAAMALAARRRRRRDRRCRPRRRGPRRAGPAAVDAGPPGRRSARAARSPSTRSGRSSGSASRATRCSRWCCPARAGARRGPWACTCCPPRCS